MDTVLLILGILGFGAVIIAAYVFLVAARNYVSENDIPQQSNATLTAESFIERVQKNRRKLVRLDFPMTVNGALIPFERRILSDRRAVAA